MNITLTIPVIPILIGVAVYLVIGLLLTPALVKWQSRFISGRRRSMWEGVRVARAFAATAAFWPLIFFFTIKTEVDYRRKGYL